MVLISRLADKIEEELNDAESYIEFAEETKECYPKLSEELSKISTEEMGHAERLHNQVVAIIDEYRKEHGEPSERMMGRYEYIHDQFKKKSKKIKIMQAMFNSK